MFFERVKYRFFVANTIKIDIIMLYLQQKEVKHDNYFTRNWYDCTRTGFD